MISSYQQHQCETVNVHKLNIFQQIIFSPARKRKDVTSDIYLLYLGETKKALLLLKDAIIEGEKCRDNAAAMQEKLENMCTLLKPLKDSASKFERVLKLLKKIHTALDKGTKFINNIPKIGKIRKVLMEKVMPVVLDALETINKGLWKVVDYADKLLEYKDKKKGFKLLWEIDKKGMMCVCITQPLSFK